MASRQSSKIALDGVVLLDKPIGCSSNQALQKVKFILQAQKAGHTGTLDPFATGLLPLTFGFGTKFSQALLNADKTYLATLYLGRTTTTGDIDGEILSEIDVLPVHEQIERTVASFVGEQEQKPPMYSALKVAGRPLYEYARQGIVLEREVRRIHIYAITVLSVELPYVTIRVHCSKGTYIRTLAEDIGQSLGCGAYLTALRREQIAHLNIHDAHTIESIQKYGKNALLPMTYLAAHWQQITLDTVWAARFLQGQRLRLPDHLLDNTSIEDGVTTPILVLAQINQELKIIGVGYVVEGVLHPKEVNSGVSIQMDKD